MNKSGITGIVIKTILIVLFVLFLVGLVISIVGFVFKEGNNKSSPSPSPQISQISQISEDNNYPKTFFIDIDGTIVPSPEKGQLDKLSEIDGYVEDLLPGVKDFFNSLKDDDVVIFTTGRREKHRKLTERTLNHHNIKYKHIIMDLPWGQRYLINDTTNILYQKAIGINLLRDKGFGDIYNYDPKA